MTITGHMRSADSKRTRGVDQAWHCSLDLIVGSYITRKYNEMELKEPCSVRMNTCMKSCFPPTSYRLTLFYVFSRAEFRSRAERTTINATVKGR